MDYKFKTTFWQDFTIAEQFGVKAIQDTFDRAFNEWKNNYVYLTELVMVLNWKIGEWYENTGAMKKFDYSMHDYVAFQDYAKLYNDLWEKADEYAMSYLKGGDLEYFLETTD